MSIDEKSRYYDTGGIEVIEIIAAKLTNEQFKGYLLGNQIKYLCRANWKGGSFTRDIEKAGVYNGQLLKMENKSCDKCLLIYEYNKYTFCPHCGRKMAKR